MPLVWGTISEDSLVQVGVSCRNIKLSPTGAWQVHSDSVLAYGVRSGISTASRKTTRLQVLKQQSLGLRQ